MNKIAKILTGSRLYNTHRENSDYDFRGLYLPSIRDCYLNQVKETINVGPEELYYSIHKFLDLAVTGQPVALECLFAPETNVEIFNSRVWNRLVSRRKEFLNKKMDAFLGFGRSLSSKYAVKAERFNMLAKLISFIGECNNSSNIRLSDVWNHLPLNEFCSKETDAENRVFYVVLSRKYMENTLLKDFISALEDIRNDYGARVKAAESGMFDSKSVSHCFRIAYQLQDIAKYGELIFPLTDERVDFLKKVKNREVNYNRDDIFGRLDEEIKVTEKMLSESSLPESIPQKIKYEILDFVYDERHLYNNF
jgi:hypothetical protein